MDSVEYLVNSNYVCYEWQFFVLCFMPVCEY